MSMKEFLKKLKQVHRTETAKVYELSREGLEKRIKTASMEAKEREGKQDNGTGLR